jgi:predicted ribosome quality control (RQC) complex YloA/Tae2 family protein
VGGKDDSFAVLLHCKVHLFWQAGLIVSDCGLDSYKLMSIIASLSALLWNITHYLTSPCYILSLSYLAKPQSINRHYQASSSNSMPSSFTMKLRKHLRSLRLENVSQLGNLDRVVDFRFGSGANAHHVILELYGRGNLILTDGEYTILGLLRNFEYEVSEEGKEGDEEKKEEVKVRVGNVYPVTFATTLSAPVNDEHGAAEKNADGEESKATSGLLTISANEAYEWARSELELLAQRAAAQNASDPSSGKGGKKKGGNSAKGGKKKSGTDDSIALKALLLRQSSGLFHYGPSLIEHCISNAGLDPLVKLTYDNIEYSLPEASWEDLLKSLREEGSKVIDNLSSGESGGYILYKPKSEQKEGSTEEKRDDKDLVPSALPTQNQHADKILLEFQPHLLQQHRNQNYISFPTFAAAIDEFFSHLSSQRLAQRADAAEAAARDRLSKIRLDQQRRAEGLAVEREKWKHSAELVEIHAEDVDRALGVISSALESGMDWNALEQLVLMEKENENPIALLIHKLELDKDTVILALPDIDDWDDDMDAPKIHNVSLSIKESAHGNAREMFARYRASKEKEEKTAESSTMALEAAEAKAKKQLAEAQRKKELVRVLPARKPMWFEKFAWFITSDNYLVVAGKDAQQNEQLVKRYLRPGDAYLHAEVHGAATCILRAKRRRMTDGKTQVIPLSDRALSEAGTFTICRSSAWSSKMVTSAYWVESHQVSKTAPTGEYLTVGSFMIRGRKNFLPASNLEMGLGVLFRLGDDASIARHANERRDFALIEHEEMMKKQEINTPVDVSKTHDEEADEGSDDDCIVEEQDNIEPNRQDDQDVITDNAVESEANENPVDDEDSDEAESDGEQGATPTENKKVSFESAETEHQKPVAPAQRKKQKELSRGKRAKAKRAKQKYSEQDEEDKELAMLALQGGEAKRGKKGKGSKIQPKQSETQQKAASETMVLLVRDSKKVAETLDVGVKDILAKCVTVKVTKGSEGVRWNKFDAEVLEQLRDTCSLEEQLASARRLLDLSKQSRIDNFSASLSGIIRTVKRHGTSFKDADGTCNDGKQRKTKAEKQAEKQAWQEILAEDGILEKEGDDGDVVDDSNELAKLTGKPASDDVILCAVPVCAPYNVLSQYKYRVKLTPGSVKRGKASKQCIEMFLRGENDKKGVDDTTKRDRELIKLVNENEWVQSIIGDVRITSAGASKVQKQQKAKSKAKAMKK